MCGIAGFLGRFDADLLDGMGRSIAHRGPDDTGHLSIPESGLGLVHRRLAIIDLSPLGHQPMWDDEGAAAIVFNGEIFNYRELRATLAAEGHRFRSQSDTEVVLHLYRRHGVEMLSRLNGMFAFALWDARSKELFVARDGAGVKPLYWAETPRGFLFASEIKALLTSDDVARDLDPFAIRSHLAFLWSPAPDTVLRSVKKLPPGHAMIVSEGRVRRTWAHYDLPYREAPAPMSVPEAAERVRDAVATAVKRQMVADVPVGAFLSGGLDSSSIVAFASREAPPPMDVFSIGFSDGDAMRREGFADDLPYARAVAERFGARLHVVEVGHEMAGELETMIWHLDEPTADPAPINALLICRLARERGLKVLLSGTGGDDIFTGYRRHLAVLRERYWAFLPKALRASAAALGARVPAASPLGRRAQKLLRYAGLEGDDRLVSYFYWIPPETLAGLYGPLLREALAGSDPGEPLRATLTRLPASTSPLRRMLYLEGKHFLADHNLNYGDKMSMASGVEVRVPLLDPDLVALAASIPDALKQRGSTGKWIFKKAMEPVLPPDVIYRPKTGFGVPLRRWLRVELRPLVEEVLAPARLRDRGLFDPAAVARLRADDLAGRLDGTYAIFALVCLELWCRAFVDAPARTGVTA
jgi:asparagine synthase (glutamine-hydrolysing)